LASPHVSFPEGDETKSRRDETIFVPGEDIRKPAVGIKAATNYGPKAQ
jgi:hypothetical protein